MANRRVVGSDVVAYFSDAANVVTGLVRSLDAANIPLTGLDISQPSLDDVFLNITGDRLAVQSASVEDEAASS